MIIKTNSLNLRDKEVMSGTSSKTGREYTMYKLYFKAEDGLLYQLITNKAVFDRAEKEKIYKVVIEISTQGQFRVNDIELQK